MCLDTKYKAGTSPSQDDIFQIVTYAKLKDCREAILVYPITHNLPLDVNIGDVHVRGLAFMIDGNLNSAGQQFLKHLVDSQEMGW
jgi:5-methylcytosine-specific restriction enzyme subunit McrC